MAYDKITLHGRQVCNYLYIQDDEPTSEEFVYIDDEPKAWKDTTVLYANFNNKDNPLCAGDSVAVGSISGYEVYRKKYNESHAEYIGTIRKSKQVLALGEELAGYEQALEEEYQKVSAWGLSSYLQEIKIGTVQSVFGSVDMNNRTVITWTTKTKRTYQNALASWSYVPEIGTIDTVYGCYDKFEITLDNGEKIEWQIAFTPILQNGTFLSQNIVYEYIYGILNEAYKNNGNVNEEILKSIDRSGRYIDDIYVHGIFAAIDEASGNWAETVSKLMHFAGAYGAVQLLQKNIEETEKAIAEKSDFGDVIVDYAAKNGVEYSYYFYPNADKSQGGAILSPLVTDQVAINCPYWSLLIVDDTEEENVFYLDKLFKFELNLQIDDMNNNAQVSIIQNFTKYPTIQYGASNYWTGSLSSLCGFITANCVDYVQNTNMIQELKSISSDTRRKFLKDTEGNLWEVDIAAPLSITTENTALMAIKTLRLSWAEVGDANGISIINNPDKPITDWVLTDTGMAVPYYTYQWGENYVWDNSCIWTAHNDANINDITNLGREIIDEGGDIE